MSTSDAATEVARRGRGEQTTRNALANPQARRFGEVPAKRDILADLPTAATMALAAARVVESSRRERATTSSRRADDIEARRDAFMTGMPGPDVLNGIIASIKAAADRGDTEVVIYNFPSEFCDDRGRAINNGLRDWPSTVRGVAAGYVLFFDTHLRPRGYRLFAQILTWPDGMPGDVGLCVSWRSHRE